MLPDLSLLPYDPAAPRDADGVPLAVDIEQLRLDLRHCYLGGRNSAQENFVPLMLALRAGKDPDTIETSIRTVMSAGMAALYDEPFTAEHRQAWCLGFRIACAPAKRQAMAAGAGKRAVQGLELLVAGYNALAEAAALAASPAPVAALPGLGAPLPRHRPLRPEDFGALPAERDR